jgi:hypothetical protein
MKGCVRCGRLLRQDSGICHFCGAEQYTSISSAELSQSEPSPTLSEEQQSNLLMLGTRITVAEALVILFLLGIVFVWKSYYISQQLVPVWDGAVYLLDAHDLLAGQQLYEWFRPLLLPGIIALVWSLTGENYLFVRFFNLIFTLATAGVLYYSIRFQFGRLLSILGAVVYLTSYQILIWSDQILVHGLTSLFLVLAVLALRKDDYPRSVAGGVFACLACLARYTSVAIAFPIVVAYAIDHRRPKIMAATVLGAGVTLLLYHLAFPFVLPNFLSIYLTYGESTVVSAPWYYYLTNWYTIFGFLSLFALAAILLPSTYKSISSRPWAFWLVGSLLFFTITTNKQDRFTFEWTPAVVYLAFLFLLKVKEGLSGEGIFAPTSPSGAVYYPRSSLRKLIFGIILISLVTLQVYTSVGTYIQPEQQASYRRDDNLLIVADYLKAHLPSGENFMSDYDAPVLTYFSGRYGIAIEKTTSEPDFLDYLHNYMVSTNATHLLVFPKVTGNSLKVLETSGFLVLEDTLNVTAPGPVYVFHVAT